MRYVSSLGQKRPEHVMLAVSEKTVLSALCVRVALGEKRHGQSVRLYLCLVQFSLHFAQLGLK